ncbi:MAG: hypothetical protein ACKVTZ_11455 [Bacteroidia bacterium]
MRIFFFLFCFMACWQLNFAQTDSLVKDTVVAPKKPSRKYKRSEFSFVINRAFLAGQKNVETAPLNPLGSGSMDLGFAYGFRLPRKWTIHIQGLITTYKLNFATLPSKTFPDTLHQGLRTQKLRFMGATLPFGVIYNLKEKDGKRITYAELGVWGGFLLPPTYKAKYVDSTGKSVVEKRALYFGLEGFNFLQSGIYARLGWKQFALYGNYRASNIFTNNFVRTDKPKPSYFELGISVVL